MDESLAGAAPLSITGQKQAAAALFDYPLLLTNYTVIADK